MRRLKAKGQRLKCWAALLALGFCFVQLTGRGQVVSPGTGTGGSSSSTNLNGLIQVGTNSGGSPVVFQSDLAKGLTNAIAWPSNGPALTINGSVQGFSTNAGVGEVWAIDYGFCYTNTAAGNSNALNLAILACSNAGGGIIRYGSRYTNTSAGQVINLVGDHLFPVMTYPQRIKLQGDGATIISFTGTTTNGVLFGQFDAENVFLSGPRNTNVTDVYPYTNLVGFFEVGFWDPQLTHCYVSGFGQGFAATQTGSFRASTYLGCHATVCDIGFAIGDQCDKTELLGSDARSCLFAFDQGCVVPNVTNSTYFPGMNSASTGTTNVIGTHFSHIEGGIWDYNYYASWVIGKGHMYLSTYAGNEHNYQLIINHPTNIITTIAYPNEGTPEITLDGCWWGENPVTTNIWISQQSAGGNPEIIIRHSPIGLATYGIIGVPSFVSWDQLSMSANGTNLWFGSPTVAAFQFNRPDEKYTTSPNTTDEFYDEPNGPYANSTIIKRIGYHISTSEVSTPLEWGFYAGDMTTRAALDLFAYGGNNYGLSGNGVQFSTTGTNSGAYGYFTNFINTPQNTAAAFQVNAVTIGTNQSAVGVLSNFVPSTGQLITNLTKSAVTFYWNFIAAAGSTTSAGASALGFATITNSGTGYALTNQISVTGVNSNTVIFSMPIMLGTNDTVKLGTTATGSGAVTMSPSLMIAIP